MRILVFFTFLFFSCSSTKELTEEKNKVQLEPVTLDLIRDFKISETSLYKLQYYSSVKDTIILQKSTDATSSQVSPDGTLILTGGTPSRANVILPGTPGVLTKIIYEEDKKIKELYISFSANKNNYLIYGPSLEDQNTFLLQTSKYLISGELSQIYVIPFYMEGQDQIWVEPGQKVDQKKIEENPEKSGKYNFQKKKILIQIRI